MVTHHGYGHETGSNKKEPKTKFDKCLKFQKVKIIFFKDVAIYFLIFFEVFLYKKTINAG
mgnify:CR=1 FL=1